MNMNTKRITKVSAFLIALTCLTLARVSNAASYNVSNTNSSGAGSLSQALSQAQSDPNATINISPGLGTTTLSGTLPAIQNNLVINGNSNAISGAGAYRIFFVNAPGCAVQINSLTLSNGVAQGGGGGVGYGGGGGGAGLGGAIFVNAGALTINGVSFTNNSAHGGPGAYGFDNGQNSNAGGGGGGGGLAFGGGSAFGDSVDDGEDYVGPGAGGGALTSAGTSVNGDDGGGPGGGAHGGSGGSLALEGGNAGNGGSPTLADGGGGGGGLTLGPGSGGNGGTGSDFGGGGGAGSSDNGNSGLGGNGGFGGGGGGGAFTDNGSGYAGGNGGFGGGGGGGGDGVNAEGAGGKAGFGGGNGDSGFTGNAGGGLGAGGAVFARLGATLTIQDSTFGGETVVAGPGAKSGASGSALGQALFLGGNVNYSVSAGTNTLADSIGGGNDANAQGSFTKSGAGTLVLTGAESYTGSTAVSEGTLKVVNNSIDSTAIALDSGAVLEYDVTSRILTPNTTYTGTGTLRVTGTGNFVFGPGVINVDFSPGALIDVEQGLLTGSSSYGGVWASNYASLNIASNAVFDAVEAGLANAMQIGALTGAGKFQGGYSGNGNGGLTTVTMGIAGGSGTFSGIFTNDYNARLGIIKTGAGTEVLSGISSYSGGTTVKGGTLVINGTSGSGSVTVSGGTLSGHGTIAGSVTIGANGTLAPGAPLGTLTISNSLILAGNTIVALSSGTNCQVAGLTSVTYGGTLTITNLGEPLSAGSTFTLFNAASASGNFASIVGGSGSGLLFNFNPTNGVLSVVGPYPSSPTNMTYRVNSGAMTVSWPANYTGWILQAQTNPPTMGITTNWVDVAGSASVDSMSFAMSRTNSVFFRMRLP
jgi:autotransporter-associated beta strand protein